MTKILYMDHPQFDLGAYNLYNGLCEAIGPENVVTFPYKKIYYGRRDHFNDGYIQFLREYIENCYIENCKNGIESLPYGIPPFQVGEDIINGYPGAFDRPYLTIFPEQPEYSEDDIIRMIQKGEFSFIMLTSGNRCNTITLARIRDRIGGLDKLPSIVYVDNGERDEMNEHWAHVFRPKVMFKLILTPEVYNYIKGKYGWELHCLPESSPLAEKDIKTLVSKYSHGIIDPKLLDMLDFDDSDDKKDIDIYYPMGSTYDKRGVLSNIITEYIKKNHRTGYYQHIHYGKYLSNFAHSKIGVTMRGSGRDTTRYWDIPLFRTLMVCDGTMGCMHPYPFEDRKTAVFYDENRLDKVPDIIEYYLTNDKERRRIADAGYQHLREYHTNRKRAEYFLDITGKELRQL